MKEVQRLIQEAGTFGQSVVAAKGLTVRHDEVPTREQAALAALHAREDAAACFFLLTKVLERQIVVRRCAYLSVFLLILIVAKLY
jgi:hypothetical protein